MSSERCAVVGVGMTKMSKCRDDVSMAGLVREAATRALEDAEMTWADVEAVVIGTAPDIFEGVMMPELYLADALGAALGLGDDVVINPSGGALVANPVMATGLVRIGEAFNQVHDHGRSRVLGHASSGPCLQQNLVCVLEGRS